jgi:hydroxypyruvate isomerase
MRATNHKNVGLCWNSNPTDIVDGRVKLSFDLLRPWLRSCHINELPGGYPYKELFRLMKASGYDRWTLCEAAESKEPERFLKYYRALWRELMA